MFKKRRVPVLEPGLKPNGDRTLTQISPGVRANATRHSKSVPQATGAHGNLPKRRVLPECSQTTGSGGHSFKKPAVPLAAIGGHLERRTLSQWAMGHGVQAGHVERSKEIKGPPQSALYHWRNQGATSGPDVIGYTHWGHKKKNARSERRLP